MDAMETTTLRDKVRAAITDEVPERIAREHRQNYHKLHIRRDGTVHWTESIDQHSDIIDDGAADHFCAVKSVCGVGTGSYSCNCDYCNEVYSELTEELYRERGDDYKRGKKYETQEDAISDAVCDSDQPQVEADMLAKLDRIEVGYFDDEDA